MENKKIILLNEISIGITHIDGRILFKNHNSKWSKMYISVCHYIPSVYTVFPRDYERPLMVATIHVDATVGYCSRGKVCLDFKCELNRFRKEDYVSEFGDCGAFTLGLPQDFGEKDIWFNEGKWRQKWADFMIPVEGGILRFNEESYNE